MMLSAQKDHLLCIHSWQGVKTCVRLISQLTLKLADFNIRTHVCNALIVQQEHLRLLKKKNYISAGRYSLLSKQLRALDSALQQQDVDKIASILSTLLLSLHQTSVAK